jgi:hypothetical protein
MSDGKSTSDWVSFSCPACRSNLKIRTAYAHLHGRCPECGYRVDAPRPQPAVSTPVRSGDADIGLEPIEEEWPEPARVESGNDAGLYTMAPLPPPVVVHGLAAGGAGQHPPTADDPYAVMEPIGQGLPPAMPFTERLSEAETNPLRPPPPPPYPLVQGIYSFPWWPENLVTWVMLAAELTLLTLLARGLVVCLELIQQGEFTGAFIVPLIAVTCVAGLWIGAYAAVQFFTAIEETAAGNDLYPRPEWTMWEGIVKLSSIFAVLALSALPAMLVGGMAAAVVPVPAYAWLLPPIISAVFFPILLLSTMSSDAMWKMIDFKVVLPLLAKPHALLALYVPSWAMLGLCLVLSYETVVRARLEFLPLTGAVLAACLLIYGRLLGRIGWYITLRKVKKARRKKPEPQREMSEAE